MKPILFLTFLVASLLLLNACERKTTDELEPVTLTVDPLSVTSTSVDLSWTRTETINFLQYEIHYSTQRGFALSEDTFYEEIDDRSETYTFVTDLEPSTTYFFKIRVLRRDGKFADSNEEGATTAQPAPEVYVRFIHTASALPGFSLSVGGAPLGTLNYEDAISYRFFDAGVMPVVLRSGLTKLDSANVFFVPSTKATVFILDKPTSSSPRFVYLMERYTFQAPVSMDDALIRFVNTSLHLDSAKVHADRAGGLVLGGAAGFGKASSYVTWPQDTVTLFLTRATDTVSIASLPSVIFRKANRYTITTLDSLPSPRLKVLIDD